MTKTVTRYITEPVYGRNIYEMERTWEVQKKPYLDPLAFSFSERYFTSWQRDNDDHIAIGFCVNSPSGADITRATNSAYGSFVEQVHGTAGNANNLLEANDNFSVIAKHAKTLSTAYAAAKRLDPSGVAKALGLKLSSRKKSRIKKRAKQASDMWLEFHFGWEPLVQDIGTSIDAIQAIDFGYHRVQAHGSASVREYLNLDNDFSRFYDRGHKRYNGNVKVKMQADVKISNPNAALANQLGFVNPLSVAWEAVPFSFVVDWFANVGQCLSACTDFVGYQLIRSFTTTFWKVNTDYFFSREDWFYHETHFISYTSTNVQCNRGYGITGPSLAFKPVKALSPVRAATAISLLVQTMRH